MMRTPFSADDGVYVIAEAGVNHGGSLGTAKRLVDAAVEAGADAVKFQIFRPEATATEGAGLAEYQRGCGYVDQSSLLQRLALSHDDFRELAAYCRDHSVEFLASVFDEPSVELLKELRVRYVKIPSGEVTNTPLLERVAQCRLPVILSTGMASLREIEEAVAILTGAGTEVMLLHCTSAYPPPMEQVHLRAMETLRRHFRVPVGLSDHTDGIEVPIAAVALGAVAIEKHLTLDRNATGPDHRISLESQAFREMVDAIRNVEKALGLGEKVIQECERNTAEVARKSLVMNGDLKAGQAISADMLSVKRPGTGIPPRHLQEVTGRKVCRDMEAGAVLTWNDLQ